MHEALGDRGPRGQARLLGSACAPRRARPDLAQALEAYGRKFAAEDIGHVVRSLVYFDDAEAEPMPMDLSEAHWARIKQEVRTWVEAL